jgi:very-short-patch-repair endonuclease
MGRRAKQCADCHQQMIGNMPKPWSPERKAVADAKKKKCQHCGEPLKNRRSSSCKRCFTTVELPSRNIRQKHTMALARSAASSRGPKDSGTKLEQDVAELLTVLGYGFQREVAIGTYNVDFLLEDGRIVEAYGWHHDRLNKNHDKKRIAWLKRQGHEVIVLWHHSPHLWWSQFLTVQ